MRDSIALGLALELMTYFGFTLKELVAVTDLESPSIVTISKNHSDHPVTVLRVTKPGKGMYHIQVVYTRQDQTGCEVRARLHTFWDHRLNRWTYLLTPFDGRADLAHMLQMQDEWDLLRVQ